MQRCIGAVRAEVWERINRVLLGRARDDKIEAGRKVRIDSTVTETHILEPSDSQLLYDAVRVLSRLLARGLEKVGTRCLPLPRPPPGGEAEEVEDPQGADEA